jgi:hypothetical protein
VKVIATDGAGSGAAVTDALSGLEGSFSAITTTGNAGIGTSTPNTSYVLDVSGAIPAVMTSTSTATTAMYGGLGVKRETKTNGDGTGIGFILEDAGDAETEYAYIGGIIESNTAGSEDGGMILSTTLNNVRTQRMRITSEGNVGIGVTAPSAFNQSVNAPHLVVGNGSNSPGLTLFSGTGTQGTLNFADGTGNGPGGVSGGAQYVGRIVYTHASDLMSLQTANVTRLAINADGAVFGNGSLSADTSITLQGDTGGYVLKHVRDSHALTLTDTDGSGEVLRVSTSGQVLIGTTSDSYIHEKGLRIKSNEVGSHVLDAAVNIEGSGGDFYALNMTGPTDVGFGMLVVFSDNTDSVYWQYRASGSSTNIIRILADGSFHVFGSFSKASGSFKIDHPLPAKAETHHLVHSFIEGPQADNIYRGKVDLVGGSATVNIDTAAGMTEGTYVLLNTNTQCFTSNESGWTAVKGSVSGNTLTITAQDNTCTDTISWMVVGERHDQHMLDTEWTDENGKVIVEPKKEDT